MEIKKFIKKYQEEVSENLKILSKSILDLESSPSNKEELLNQIYRYYHTIKGSSFMVGYGKTGELAHDIENIITELRENKLEVRREIIDIMLKSIDEIEYMALSGEEEKYEEERVEEIRKEIKEIIEGEKEVKVKAVKEKRVEKKKEEEDKKEEVKDKTYKPMIGDTIKVSYTKIDGLLNLAGEIITQKVRLEERIEELNSIKQQWRTLQKMISEVREQIMVLENSILSNSIEEVHQRDKMLDVSIYNSLQNMNENTTRLGIISQKLRELTVEMRMLPISIIMENFNRAVRDMARKFEKEVELEIEGGETEVDKKMLEVLHDPLIHLLRNAVDHGIETAADRQRKGKSRKGTIRIKTYTEGDRVVISIKDDGRGIDIERVKEKAVKKEIITEEEKDKIKDRQAVYLIFVPGLSTSEVVTEISGRGVGMDVVKENVDSIKGEILIETQKGEGTEFIIKLPLTLATINVLLIEIQKRLYAIPSINIEKITTIREEEIQSVEGRKIIKMGRRLIPIVNMSEILGYEVERMKKENINVVIVSYNRDRIGFIVDECKYNQELMIKNMPFPLGNSYGITGLSILGNGEVVIIINMSELMEMGKKRVGAISYKRVEEVEVGVGVEKIRGKKRVLIAEDAFTIRELEKGILEGAGYEVEIATDGLEALHKITKEKYDLLITDIQMPRMDGFELIEKIKGQKELKDIRIIITTVIESVESKQRGIELGVDAYIVKSSFEQLGFLNTIRRLIGS